MDSVPDSTYFRTIVVHVLAYMYMYLCIYRSLVKETNVIVIPALLANYLHRV